MANIFPIDFEEKLTMAQDDYILFSDSEDWNKIKKAQYKNLKWEKGDTWPAWKDGTDGKDWTDWESATITVGSTSTLPSWSSATVTNSWTPSAAVLDFGIPQWPKGEDGKDGTDGKDWTDWKDGADWAAATITVWSTSTLSPWSSATVTNSWTSSAAVFDFWIPQWATWATWNWIASITSEKVWKITTVTITETNSTVDTFQISDGADGQWSWDVVWPASSTDWDVVIFDWVSGKLIKDGSVALSTLSAGASAWATALQPSAISDTAYGSGWDADTTHAPSKNAVYDKIQSVVSSIPTVNNATLTIQKNGTDVQTFTANQSTNATANITVPTDTSDLTNWAGFITGITSWDVTTALWYTPYNSTNPSGYVTSSIISDTAYWSWWDADTTHAPTKNAVYDKLNAMDTTIAWKQPTLVSWTNIKTINWNSILWSGNLQVWWITKVFTLSSTSDLTTAQAAYDWYVNGGNPIIKLQFRYYRFNWEHNWIVEFTASQSWQDMSLSGTIIPEWTTWLFATYSINMTVSSWNITWITLNKFRVLKSTRAPTSWNDDAITFVI